MLGREAELKVRGLPLSLAIGQFSDYDEYHMGLINVQQFVVAARTLAKNISKMKTKLAIELALVALLAADFVRPAAAKKFWEDDLPSGIAGRALTNAYVMAGDAVLVLKALKAYPPGARIPESDVLLKLAWQKWE
jgi:hypothetical protein